MKALASITLDHEFVVHDLRVIEGNSGLFVAMPSKRTPMRHVRIKKKASVTKSLLPKRQIKHKKKTGFLFLGKPVFFLDFSSILLRPIIE